MGGADEQLKSVGLKAYKSRDHKPA